MFDCRASVHTEGVSSPPWRELRGDRRELGKLLSYDVNFSSRPLRKLLLHYTAHPLVRVPSIDVFIAREGGWENRPKWCPVLKKTKPREYSGEHAMLNFCRAARDRHVIIGDAQRAGGHQSVREPAKVTPPGRKRGNFRSSSPRVQTAPASSERKQKQFQRCTFAIAKFGLKT